MDGHGTVMPVTSSRAGAPGFPVVGVVGGGQLARMMQPAAINLGITLRVLATSFTESAAQVIPDTRIGSHHELDDLIAFAEGCDVITFDHEHVPPAYLDALVERGVAVRPGPRALVHAQDKIEMRRALTEAGIPNPRWTVAVTAEDVDDFAAGEWPVVLKTSRGGYDGRGVWVVDSKEHAHEVISTVQLGHEARWLVEEAVAFTRELSAQVARSPHGQAVAYPVVRTVQTNGMCTEVVAPCPDLEDDHAIAAQRIALHIAAHLDVTGMLAVEMFDTPQGVLVNELAMRPHNSGHWTIDGAITSQFENHLRAVLDLPLGSPLPRDEFAVMVNVVGSDAPDLYPAYRHAMARDPQLKVHMYGKDVRPGRKIGHVTATGNDLADLLERAHHAADYLAGDIDE